MLEALVYNTYKKHKLAKDLRETNAKEALSKEDEEFIRESIDNKPPTNTTSMFKFTSKKKSSHNKVSATTDDQDEGILHRWGG